VNALALIAGVVAVVPTFAAPNCDALVGQYSKAASGEPWLRIVKNGPAYSASTHGHLFARPGEKGNWNDEPVTPLTLISKDRLEANAEANGNRPPAAEMCGLSGGRLIFIKVPVGYRYGQERDEVSKTGYVLAVYADENGYGAADLYPIAAK
jgi:hypothetical protein